MKLTVRRAAAADLPTLLKIFDNARAFMRTHGNPHQWPDSYPGAARLAAEIERGVCYVVMGQGAIQAVFCLIPGDEPTYRIIEDGAWPEDLPYATIHRMASAGQVRGIGQFCIDWCLRQGLPVRADTHADNVYMQRALEKSGFVRCGRIYTEDGSPRWAYYHKAATQKGFPRGGKLSAQRTGMRAAFRLQPVTGRSRKAAPSSALGQSLGAPSPNGGRLSYFYLTLPSKHRP